MTHWQRWISHPQTTWVRKATFQLHMWSGIGLGLYVLLVSVTGSIVVYRNELYRAATPNTLRIVSRLLELHDDLLAGDTGRKVNGVGALLLIVMALSGIVV